MNKRRQVLATLLASTAWPLSANEGTRTITDMAGRRIVVPARVQRVVTLGSIPVINSLVFTMGEGGKVINGLADYGKPHWKYQTIFAPNIARQPTMQQPNREPNLETLLAGKPDVVLTMNSESLERLDALKIPTIFLAWQKADDAKACMTLLGELFGKPEVAQRYVRWFDGTLGRVQEGLRGVANEQRPKVLYFLPENMTQPRLIAEWWIPAGGGISVTDDGRKTEVRSFTLEQVLAWNPDHLILGSVDGLNRVKSDRAFSSLKAVRNGALHLVPVGAHTWSNRTAEQPLTVLWAAKTFHPQRFASVNLGNETRQFYRDFFGYTLNDAELAEILSGTL